MLGLRLRDEFRGRRLRGTAIELANESSTGATQVAATSFLDITYPSLDVRKAPVSPREVRTAAAQAASILRRWKEEGRERVFQLPLFLEEAS